MIQLLTTVVVMEGITALFFTIDLPSVRKLVKRLDELMIRKFSAMIKTLAGTMLVILLSSITSIMKIQGRNVEVGAVTPTDQILLKTHMLEASLMGYALLLGLIIDRLHHFVRKIDALEKTAKIPQIPFKQVNEKSGSNMMQVLKDEITELRHKLQKLSLDSETIEKQAKSAEANAKALEEQAQGFVLKYDHLAEDNQNLQSQISALKKTSSNVDGKKDA